MGYLHGVAEDMDIDGAIMTFPMCQRIRLPAELRRCVGICDNRISIVNTAIAEHMRIYQHFPMAPEWLFMADTKARYEYMSGWLAGVKNMSQTVLSDMNVIGASVGVRIIHTDDDIVVGNRKKLIVRFVSEPMNDRGMRISVDGSAVVLGGGMIVKFE